MDFYEIAQEYLNSAEAAKRTEEKYRQLSKEKNANKSRCNAIGLHWGVIRREHTAIARDFLERAKKYNQIKQQSTDT